MLFNLIFLIVALFFSITISFLLTYIIELLVLFTIDLTFLHIINSEFRYNEKVLFLSYWYFLF